MILCVYVCVVLEVMYTCKTGNLEMSLSFMFVLLYSVFTHVRLGFCAAILENGYVYVYYNAFTHVRLGIFAFSL